MPSPLVSKGGMWPSLKGVPPHHLTIAHKGMPGWTSLSRCSSKHGGLRVWCATILPVEGGGRRRWIRVSPTAEAPPPADLEWGEDIPYQCRGWRQLPANFNTRGPQTFPHGKCGVDTMACLPSGNAGLVAGIVRGSWSQWPLGTDTESASIIQTALGMKSHDGGRQWPLCTTSPLIPGEILVHAASRPTIWQSRLLDHVAKKTLAYAKALQYWTEKAQLSVPSKPYCEVESIVELCWAMDLMVSFTNEEVLKDALPSYWVEITFPWPADLALPQPAQPAQWECSHSRSCWAEPRGFLSAAHGERHLVPPTATTASTAPMTSQTTPTQKVVPWLAKSESKPQTSPPGLVEIAWSLLKDNLPLVIARIPTEEANPPSPYRIMGLT